ncbi:MAG: redoxin domain-containing protein [Candidatus Rokubacteria bacterium]|nr:redoxin domain-containing protein [Candidatus Rokubacteria bacterium]
MAQLRLGLPDLEKHEAELLQVTHNTVEEARRYGKFYRFDFPYLCDPARAVHERYGLALESAAPTEIVRSMAASASDLLLRGERTPLPIPFAMRYPGKDAPQAVFVIDRQGIVRAVHRMDPNAGLPTVAALLKDLASID